MSAGVDVVGLFQLAADAPATDSNQGPVIIVVLAVITLAGTAVTAMGPTFLEITKNRGARLRGKPESSNTPSTPEVPAGSTPPPNPAPPLSPEPTQASTAMVQQGQSGLSMVEAAVLDYRSQRDNAMKRYDAVLQDLEEARDIIREQAVYIAQLEGALGVRRQSYRGRQGPSADTRQQGWIS